MRDKWPSRFKYDPLDYWHVISSKLRRAIKGWGQNLDSQRRKQKEEIIRRIAILDDWSEERELAHLEWEERYALDHTFNQMLLEEELQWQRRGGEKWLLAGDSKSSYFHKCANGRRGKMHISMLEVNGQEVVEPDSLKDHITEYYKRLFGSEDVADMHLDRDLWPSYQQIQQEENEFLTRPFSLEELDVVIKEMKNNTALGPDGFSIEFFKAF